MQNLNRLQVGIDVSRQRLDFALLAPDGQALLTHTAFANSHKGYQDAKRLLLNSLQEHGFAGLDIAAEATSYYWLPAFLQVCQDPQLAGYAPRLYLLNARWVRWYKQSLSPDHKDDFTDPQYIADRIRTRKPRNTWDYDPKWLSLRLLTRLHVHLSKGLGREKNLFQLYLFLLHTTYTLHHPFRDPLGVTSRQLLRQPQRLEQMAGQSLEEIAEQLSELSGHHLPSPQTNAAALQQALLESYPMPRELTPTLQFILDTLLDTIRDLETRLQQVDEHIAQWVQPEDYPEVGWLGSVPGVGPVLAAGLAAEIGGLARFQQVPKWDKQRQAYRPRRLQEIEDAIGKIAGLWWPKTASGQFEAEERRMDKQGNAYLRYYLLQAADRMRQRIPTYAAYYQIKFDQANKHKHKRALVLLGRKALGLFVSLLYHQETYRAKEADQPLR